MTVRVIGRTIREHRRDKRRTQEVPAILNGTPVRIVDLSLGGAGAEAIEIAGSSVRGLAEGAKAILRMPQDGPFSRSFEVEITRIAVPEGRVGLRFGTLDDDQYRLIEQLVLRPSRVLGRRATPTEQ